MTLIGTNGVLVPVAVADSSSNAIMTVLELARKSTRAEVAWTSTINNGIEIVEYVSEEVRFDAVVAGQPTPVDCSLNNVHRRRVSDHEPPIDLSDTNRCSIGMFVGVPIQIGNAAPTGMLCCASSTPNTTLATADASFLELLADTIAIERAANGATGANVRDSVRRQVEAVIAHEQIQIVHQPIVGLVGCNIVGAEALARFASPPHRPDLWFGQAESVGLGVQLELAAIRAAIHTIDQLPKSAYLALNAGPATMCSAELLEIVDGPDASRIVVELTEHAAIDDYDELGNAIGALRTCGARLAIDDVGAGYSSFNHVLRLDPDIVKLDMTLTRDINSDVARRGLARGLLGVAHDIGATVVAEGVETQAELDTLVDLGVDAAQGYFLARPAPLPLPDAFELPRPAPRRVVNSNSITDPRDALAHLARFLIGNTDLGQLTRPILAAVLERTGLETSYLTIKNPDTGDLDHRYVHNSSTIQLPEGTVIPWDDTLCKRSRDAGILWTPDVPRDLPGCDAANALGVQTFVSVPIYNNDGTDFGTLCAASTQTRTLDHTSIAEIGALAALIADATQRVTIGAISSSPPAIAGQYRQPIPAPLTAPRERISTVV